MNRPRFWLAGADGLSDPLTDKKVLKSDGVVPSSHRWLYTLAVSVVGCPGGAAGGVAGGGVDGVGEVGGGREGGEEGGVDGGVDGGGCKGGGGEGAGTSGGLCGGEHGDGGIGSKPGGYGGG